MRTGLILILTGLFSLACSMPSNVIVENIDVNGYVTVKTPDGKVKKHNIVSDTAIDEVLRVMYSGTSTYGGAEYFWIWHNEDGSKSWYQVTTIDQSGGGDTATSLTMYGQYEANNGIGYDSTLQYRLGVASWYYTGTESDTGYVSYFSCEQKSDTIALESQGKLNITWEVSATASGGILDTCLYHVIRGFQTGSAEKNMYLCLIYKHVKDTNIVNILKTVDYVNDTLTHVGTDTARTAEDTIIRAQILDEDSTVLSNSTCNIIIGAAATPRVTVKWHVY
jgi:hypothetical protein